MNYRSLLKALFVLVLLIWIPFFKAEASTEAWQKGITVMPESSEEYGSQKFKDSIDEAIKNNVNSVALVIPLYQNDLKSTSIHESWNTPTDNALIHGIEYLKSRNLHVMLKIHLYPNNEEWVAKIHPTDPQAWFESYSFELNHYALIAEQQHVELLCIGGEIVSMSTNPEFIKNWQSMIRTVRALYKGELTYSANWGPGIYDEKNKVTFWKDLDYIGLSAYYPITNSRDWAYWNKTQIAPLQKKYNKPILFTEIGYRSIKGAQATPWDYSKTSRFDEGEQAKAYQDVFDYWRDKNNFSGLYIWNWKVNKPTNLDDKDYTPQGKKALEIIKDNFAPQVVVSQVQSEQTIIIPVIPKHSWFDNITHFFSKLAYSGSSFFSHFYFI